MHTSVVICSGGRPQILHETVCSLESQTVAPLEIIISVFDKSAVLRETANMPLVRVIEAPMGLTKQRNKAVGALSPLAVYIAFVDDDIEFSPNYLESMEKLMDERPNVVLANGSVAANGAGRRPLTREEARESLRQFTPRDHVESSYSAYGCNMFVRAAALSVARFDERLPLYASMEDQDFSSQCLRLGSIAWNFRTAVVHLAAGGGRINGKQLGYSLLANSFYLWRKGSISWRYCADCWARGLLGNTYRWTRGKGDERANRYERLIGSLLAARDAMLLRICPERILEIS